MQVNFEKTGPCAGQVSFQIPAADFDKEVKKALKQAGRNVRMKGFRPGKIPMSVLEKGYGEDIRRQAMQHFVQQAYGKAVQDNDLKPIGIEPMKFEDLGLDDEGNFGHQFEISLRPEVELGTYKGLEVEGQPTEASDEEVEATIEDLRRQRAKIEPAEDDGLPEDGMAQRKVKWVVDEETILERDDLRLSPQQAIPGVEEEAYKEAMTGVKDDATFERVVALTYDATGILLGPQKRRMVSGRLRRRVLDAGLPSYGAYLDRVKGDAEERSRMLDALTTNETYFFREPAHFELLEGFFSEARAPWTIWSAASSTGEEPYSVAISARAHMPRAHANETRLLAIPETAPIAYPKVSDFDPQTLRLAAKTDG